ncbi:MAG TPA: DUF4331 family protein [Acidimicrobiales bacterium]|nr:DUF4331 family protein [Acidimicrobiales bacterium]
MRRLIAVLGVVAVAAALVYSGVGSDAADHLESPLVMRDGRTDINDVYAFPASTPGRAALVMTVNPGAGSISGTTFRPNANYDFVVDSNGDARNDHVYRVTFGRVRNDGQQTMQVFRDGRRIGVGSTGAAIALTGGGRARASLFDDPFFFDLQAFRDQVKGAGGGRTFCDATPTNFFDGLNVSAIVLQVPTAGLGGTDIGVWGRTSVGGTILDRMGRPAIATVLIPDGLEDPFNATHPRQDRKQWQDDVEDALLTLSGLDATPYSAAEAEGIAEFLLPDILTVDLSQPAAFPNGRALADDVIDAELPIVTGGFFGGSAVLTSDCVANDSAFRANFPYLAPANV